ncbi:thymidine kinase [Membranicola marinus]|uniref:Thymidine kinase n=1 Tax=Membranihabitans marinus TaxID=1227546 RepID=A0A953LB53_9BACT|nr:thymidine kinase [Membranihabitans marinus]MBY5958241.1 thymidine kinase [Membranihabitans marinus]
MFLEPQFHHQRRGWLEAIVGSMFSGKTEELIRRLKRSEIANQKVVVFKMALDDRYSEELVVSHNRTTILSQKVHQSSDILDGAAGYEVIGIDEVQFFDDQIIDVTQELARKGKRVIMAGLDMDFSGKPFGPVPGLMAVSEYVTKLHAICQQCGSLATHSYRLIPSRDQILVGAQEQYEARCRVCFDMGNILDFKSVNN